MVTIVFWICSALLVYVYLVYPALISILSRRFGRAVVKNNHLPKVTIVVTAYNEERCIRAKLDNLTAADYPAALVEIMVASDGSTDSTEEIASSYPGRRIRVIRVEGRCGKTACQNAAAAEAAGDVLVFTDATTRLHPQLPSGWSKTLQIRQSVVSVTVSVCDRRRKRHGTWRRGVLEL